MTFSAKQVIASVLKDFTTFNLCELIAISSTDISFHLYSPIAFANVFEPFTEPVPASSSEWPLS